MPFAAIVAILFISKNFFPPEEIKRNEFDCEIMDDVTSVFVQKEDNKTLSIVFTNKDGKKRHRNWITTFMLHPNKDGKTMFLEIISEASLMRGR